MAMRNRDGLGKATREKILRIARELGYAPAVNRQTRGRKYFGQFGLLLVTRDPPRVQSGLGSSYFHDILNGAMHKADSYALGLGVATLTVDQLKAGDLPVMLQRPLVDGLLIRSPYTPELAAILTDLREPYVLLETNRYIENATQIQLENIQAMISLADHLIAEAGVCRIATITGDMDHLNGAERLAGLQTGLQRHGVSLSENNIAFEHGFDEVSGRRGAKALFERGVQFDALVCHNDLIALGAMDVLREHGLRIGEDVLLTGFDNMDFATRLDVPLTSVDACPYHLGELGIELLKQKIDSEDERVFHVHVPTRLVKRASTTNRIGNEQETTCDTSGAGVAQ